MKALVVAILVVAVLGLAWRLNVMNTALNQQRQQVDQQRQQIQSLTAAVSDKSKQDALALQEKCATQAEKVFRALGYKLDQPANTIGADILQSHVNPAANKCFMTIESNHYQNGQMITQRFLLDAYEQREYGEYTWVSDKVKKFWEVRPMLCKEIPVGKDEQPCNSDDEYKAMVKRYME